MTGLSTKDKEYLRWISECVGGSKHKKLLTALYNYEFVWMKTLDENRANDGLSLRQSYADEHGIDILELNKSLKGKVSVLEMILALANRIESDYMSEDPSYSRSRLWFWIMLDNMGLSKSKDDAFDEEYVDEVLYIFVNRLYDRNGTGGLFIVETTNIDMRKRPIWHQMGAFLTEFMFDI